MSSFSKIAMNVVAGVMMVAGAGTAMAGDYGSAAAKQAQADSARAQAANLAKQGGWAYKSGAIDRANRDTARFQAEADAARAATTSVPSAPAPAVSPELAAAQARLETLRKAGGWAYKSGAVARAEADVRALSGPQEVKMGRNETSSPATNWGKPVERIPRVYR